MIFDIYGRHRLEVLREDGRWAIYRLDDGRRRQFSDFVIPAEMEEDQIAGYLDDMLHEAAGPGAAIRRIS